MNIQRGLDLLPNIGMNQLIFLVLGLFVTLTDCLLWPEETTPSIISRSKRHPHSGLSSILRKIVIEEKRKRTGKSFSCFQCETLYRNLYYDSRARLN